MDIEIDPSASATRIWDSLDAVIDTDEVRQGDCLICCMTDGEDLRSTATLTQIQEKVKRMNNVEVVILDLSLRSWNQAVQDNGNIVVINNQEGMDDFIKNTNLIGTKNQEEVEESTFEGSASIISFIECDQQMIQNVRQCLRKVIPYVENLTGLRYYPAPTIIVDEYVHQTEKPDPLNTAKIHEDLINLLNLTGWMTIDIDVRNYQSITNNSNSEVLKNLLNISDENQWMYYRRLCEGKSLALSRILSGKTDWRVFLYNKFNEETKELGIALRDQVDFMDDITASFSKMAKNGKFNDNPRRYDEIVKIDLSFMKDYLDKKEVTELEDCVDSNDRLLPNLTAFATVYRLATIIYKKLYGLERYGLIIEGMDTYGCYLNGIEKNPSTIRELCIKHGLPNIFQIDNRGIVLLCLPRIVESLKAQLKTLGADYTAEEKELLLIKLITATLVHEHTHGIVDLGIDLDGKSNQNNGSHGTKHKRVNEALAEWSELNYFRGDDELFNIILAHANSGSEDSWPYKWALAIENKPNLPLAKEKFKSLATHSRIDTNSAYAILKKL